MATAEIVTMPAETAELTEQALTWPERARTLKIVDAAGYEKAANELLVVKDLLGKVNDTFDPIVSKAHAAHKEALAQKKKAAEPLVTAERIIKSSIATYDAEQRRIAMEAEREAREKARREAEEQRIAEAEEAAAEGATEAEQDAILERPIIPMSAPAPTAPPPPKVAGVATREIWGGEITDVWTFMKYAVEKNRPELAGLLEPKQSAVNGLARSLKAALDIPGVKVHRTTNVAAGRR